MKDVITLSLDGIEKLIEEVKEDSWDHPQAMLKEIAIRFYNDPEFLRRTTTDDPALVVVELIHEINDSGQMSEFIEYMKKKTSRKEYYKIEEKYSEKNNDSDSEKPKQEYKEHQQQKPTEDLNDEIEFPYHLKEKCQDFSVHERNWKKLANWPLILGVMVVVIMYTGAYFFPADKKIQEVPEISVPIGIIILILLIIAGKLQNKAEKIKKRIKGFNNLTLKAYKAYTNLEKFQTKEPDIAFVEKSKTELESIVRRLETSWGTDEQFNPTFKSIQQPVSDFITFMKSKFIPSIVDVNTNEKKDEKKIVSRMSTLVKLIKLFQSENFEDINSLNKELAAYVPPKKPLKKSTNQKIRENIIITKIRENIIITKILLGVLGSSVIVIGAITLVSFLSSHPDVTYQDTVTWSLMIILGGIIPFNLIVTKLKMK